MGRKEQTDPEGHGFMTLNTGYGRKITMHLGKMSHRLFDAEDDT